MEILAAGLNSYSGTGKCDFFCTVGCAGSLFLLLISFNRVVGLCSIHIASAAYFIYRYMKMPYFKAVLSARSSRCQS